MIKTILIAWWIAGFLFTEYRKITILYNHEQKIKELAEAGILITESLIDFKEEQRKNKIVDKDFIEFINNKNKNVV